MRRDFILSVLDDLIVAAEKNCMPEVSLHLLQSRKMISPYVGKKSLANRQSAEQHVLTDLQLNLRDYEKELRSKAWGDGPDNRQQESIRVGEQHKNGAAIIYLNRPHGQLTDQ